MTRFFTLSKTMFIRSAIILGLLLTSIAIPADSHAKRVDSTYTYVSNVFDKLQGHWESLAYENRLTNGVLTFTLNDDGTLLSTQLDGSGSSGDFGQGMVDFLKKNAPFGKFPSNLTSQQLEFKVKITPGSLQMLGYQAIEKQEKDAVITYATAPLAAQPVSLFYTRALPITPGKVLDQPSTPGNTQANSQIEQIMTAYVAKVQDQVRQHWVLPQDYAFSRTSAMLMIDRDGSLMSATIKQSSGDKTVDQAAIQAITNAAPFAQAPEKVPSLPIMIEYIFDPINTPAAE